MTDSSDTVHRDSLSPQRTLMKGQQTRATILDAALGLAANMGLEGLSIGALAEVTHMSKSGVFAHFRQVVYHYFNEAMRLNCDLLLLVCVTRRSYQARQMIVHVLQIPRRFLTLGIVQ